MTKKKLMKFAAKGIPQKVVADQGMIEGVRLCTAGEAKGHGVFLEESFIDQVVALANKGQKAGVKCRFGHPNMCSESLGTYLGVFRNVKKGMVSYPDPEDPEKIIDAPCAIGDLYLAASAKETPNGDLYSYVMACASEHPDKVATSIVFEIGDWYVYDQLGNKIVYDGTNSDQYRGARDLTGKEYVTCGKLFGCDMVDEPAANEGGLFSAFSKESLAGQVTEFLDDHPKVIELLEKSPETINGFIERFNVYLSKLGKKPVKIGHFHDIEESLTSALKERDELKNKLETVVFEGTKAFSESTVKIKALEEAANNYDAEMKRLKDENASLSAERDSLKAKVEQLERRISVELSGSQPADFGKGSDAGNKTLSPIESAAKHLQTAKRK